MFDVAELLQFLAIVIVIGIVRYPQIEIHWSTLWLYSNAQFSSVSLHCVFLEKFMPYENTVGHEKDRFTLILQFIHLNDYRHYKKKGEPPWP